MDAPIDSLRARTTTLHERIEQLPYARALLDGSLPLAHYTSFLRALQIVHGALEQAVELAGDGTIRSVFGRAFERRTRLEHDLAALACDPHEVDAAALAALVLAQRIRLDGQRDPRRLLGHAYVLEGSQLGGLVQHAALAKRPELQRGGLSYLQGEGRDTRAAFELFLSRLADALKDEPALEQAEAGAVAAFEGFEAILQTLATDARTAQWLVTELNHEAGTHALPHDLREVEAALRAGEQSYRRFAYYEARYGERGLRYTRSDSAWLATLAREEHEHAQRHVAWLGHVLASRGMPRLLLELHLELLHDTLVAQVPERAPSYAALRLGAERLRTERTSAISAVRAPALIASFSAEREECGISPSEAATLVVAAVADELRGIAKAVPSLTSWLSDPQRFSRRWLNAVERTLASARLRP